MCGNLETGRDGSKGEWLKLEAEDITFSLTEHCGVNEAMLEELGRLRVTSGNEW